MTNKKQYKVTELSLNAFEFALAEWRKGEKYPRFKENEETLRQFGRLFSAKLQDFTYNENHYCYVFDDEWRLNDELWDVKDKRCNTYFINKYFHLLYTPKRYTLPGSGKTKDSKVFLIHNPLPFPGTLSRNITQPIHDFIAKPYYNCVIDIVDNCFENFARHCQSDYIRWFSIWRFITTADSSGMMFFDNGTIIKSSTL